MSHSNKDDQIHLAVNTNNRDLLQKCLNEGCQVDSKNLYGQTALTLAAWNGLAEISEILLKMGAKLDETDEDGESPLHWACGGGNMAIVELMLKHGADINSQDHAGQTPLHWATENENLDVVKYLLSKGADSDRVNVEGRKPLEDAKRGSAVWRLLATFAGIPEESGWKKTAEDSIPVGFVEQKSVDFGKRREKVEGPIPYPAQEPIWPAARPLLGVAGSGGVSVKVKGVAGPAVVYNGRVEDLTANIEWHPTEYDIDYDELVVKESIGIGAFGKVYRAVWRGTDVAVKTFHLSSALQKERFVKEASLLSRMRHPNIVQFMGVCTNPSTPFCIITEHLQRGNLYDIIHTEKLSWNRVLRLAIGAAKGMTYLASHHPRPILHRDLKTPNLLVSEEWICKISDFGYTKLSENEAALSQCGTPHWMAPEVLRGEPYDEKADVFSFGVILWELITQRRPYEGLEPLQVVGKVAYQNPPLRLEIPEEADCEFGELVEECWREDSRFRPGFPEILFRLKKMEKRVNSSNLR